MKKLVMLSVTAVTLSTLPACQSQLSENVSKIKYTKTYTGRALNQVAFPIGGMGAGMFCLEGTGAISNMSVRHQPNLFHEPCMFAAIHVNGCEYGTKVLEGQVPDRKKYGFPSASYGSAGASWGLPRFEDASFSSHFPFATIQLQDEDIPMQIDLQAWSPFIPTDQDNSSLPVGAIEYTFTNTSGKDLEATFSYSSRNFMAWGNGPQSIRPIKNGFVLSQKAPENEKYQQGDFAIFTDDDHTAVDYSWFRGGWFDPLSMAWNQIEQGGAFQKAPLTEGSPGATLFVPFKVKAGETHRIRLYMAWYVPQSNIRHGEDAVTEDDKSAEFPTVKKMETPTHYQPWYSTRFSSIEDVASYWSSSYDKLKETTHLFTDAFYDSTLPEEVIDAVGSNLSILKSPTIMRQHDGRLWNYEGSADTWGSCHGSCTHVWNYAQAIPHLFPAMERTLRETEFFVSQNKEGHQMFRTNLPIRPVAHNFYAASDGQLGGIIKIYRDWRISGDNNWLRMMYPHVKQSLDYCIRSWDPDRVGALVEPHHNTYDIEFWGSEPMCTSFYAAALHSFTEMGKALGEDVSEYERLLEKSQRYMTDKLFDGEYFIQNIQWKGLKAPDPVEMAEHSWNSDYSDEAKELLLKEGPKYQYGKGCLSDGVLGCWMSLVAGLQEPIESEKIKSHLNAIYKYNLRKDLSNHANPQRPTYGMGDDGGLLLCTWPKGGKLSLPFIYSNEVWTGIEYQVASHLIFEGEVEKGLDIVRTLRGRYNGVKRNPYNEYECGSWYARALSSYSLLQALTGIRYDAVEKTLYVDSKIGNEFRSFLSTNTGFGTVTLKGGKVIVKVVYGTIDIKKCINAGDEVSVEYEA